MQAIVLGEKFFAVIDSVKLAFTGRDCIAYPPGGLTLYLLQKELHPECLSIAKCQVVINIIEHLILWSEAILVLNLIFREFVEAFKRQLVSGLLKSLEISDTVLRSKLWLYNIRRWDPNITRDRNGGVGHQVDVLVVLCK